MLALLLTFGCQSSGGSNGVRQTKISDDLLKHLLPNLENPRLMTLEDLRDDFERSFFKDDKFSFVIEHDFNEDGISDYAIAGKDASRSPFVLILGFKQNAPIIEYFHHFTNARQLSLKIREKCRGKHGVMLTFTQRSDDVEWLIWDGERYQIIETCSEPLQ